MNLWAKQIGQLVVLAVALFFLSCQDEAGLLGYKNPNTKFQVNYVEIPIESSVLLLDSQRTSNYLFSNETNRLLVGKYVDDQFGSVSASAYSHYYTTSGTALPANAVYDSVSVRLLFDYYTYGSALATTSQNISVHEIEEEMASSRRFYFNKTQIQTSPTALGSKDFTIDPAKFKEYLNALQDSNSQNDTLVETVRLNIPLEKAFGQRIFENAMAYSANPTVDTTFITYSLFTKIFKGISFKSNNADKVVGFNPAATSSSIAIHYHTAEADSLVLSLGFFNVNSFSQILNDRSGTALAGLSTYSQDFIPPTDFRYIQSGTGVYTKLDFSKFFEFADTVPNLVINSAQLTVEAVEQPGYDPSSSFALRILDDQNFVEKYNTETSKQDSIDFALYNPRQYASYPGSISIDDGTIGDNDNAFYAVGDQSPYLAYSSTTKSYSGNYSLFFQQLSVVNPNRRRFQSAILYPASPGKPSSSKTLNRTIIPESGIKLKVYYTKPTTPLN
jgi:hypothetical protein